MSIKHAILGVLLQGPAHGYRIKKIFAPFVAKGGLNDGQLYPVLTHLERQKLVRKETVRQQKSPNKNLYHITERGREEFFHWLGGPEDEIDPVKYDFFTQYSFLMKCNFFEHLPRRERTEKLKRQREAAEQKISEYEQIREEMLKRRLDTYKIKIVEFGIQTQLLKIRWVNDLLKGELRKNSRGGLVLKNPGKMQATKKEKPASVRVKDKSTKRKG
ncbi:MAG: PadR family transcriptional regulator [Candidatus Hydrogenedentota bacterium]|nr:MAG: PadR family transcriptional regulator [Candidatus Hydrogenedentota bacterium]